MKMLLPVLTLVVAILTTVSVANGQELRPGDTFEIPPCRLSDDAYENIINDPDSTEEYVVVKSTFLAKVLTVIDGKINVRSDDDGKHLSLLPSNVFKQNVRSGDVVVIAIIHRGEHGKQELLLLHSVPSPTETLRPTVAIQ